MADIFRYLDYRSYLRDEFDERKRTRPGFSHRAFARMAGFKSSNYAMLVIQGKRNLSGDGIMRIARALKLRKSEAEFFENLVRFNQAASDIERNFHYARMSSNRRYAKAKPLEKGQFEYYSKWYIPVIREMVMLRDFKEDAAWIAARVQPPITPREAEAALALLIELGLIVRDGEGRLRQRDAHIASGDEVHQLSMTNFQREMIERAAASIEGTDARMREIGSVTFAVSQDMLVEAKRMIREFRSRLSGFLAGAAEADAVYQFNIQLFNVSRLEKKEE